MFETAPLLDDPIHNLRTIRDLHRWAVTEMENANLSYGHGSPSALEEASFLICRALKLPFEAFEQFYDAALTHNELVRVVHLIDRRVHDRVPTAYLLKEAWLTGHRFYVDERALIPRSYIAELIEHDLYPWVDDAEAVETALDLCTGSGCLAILLKGILPNAKVTGSDISADALEVAKINRRDYDMENELELVQSDLFANLAGRRFDLIISNPPYVTERSMQALPQEYRHEPALALGAGPDGMAVVSRIVREAKDHLTEKGILIVEVGDGIEAVEAAFPRLPLTWLTVSGGDDQVFLARAEDLRKYFKD